MLVVSVIVLYLNHFLIAETLYALDIYHIEVDTSLLRYYFWITILIVILIVGLIAWLFDYKFERPHRMTDVSICESIIHEYGGNYLSHLVYSGDKDCFIDENEKAFLMYRYKSNTLVVLGDPIEIPTHLNLYWKNFINLLNIVVTILFSIKLVIVTCHFITILEINFQIGRGSNY